MEEKAKRRNLLKKLQTTPGTMELPTTPTHNTPAHTQTTPKFWNLQFTWKN